MKTYKYSASISKDGYLPVPDDIKKELKPATKVRVMILLEEENAEWSELTLSEFLKGYSEKDSIYDAL